MSDMPSHDHEGQPSEEEIRAYLEQLRDAPVDQVLAEVCSALINAAQVKAGRVDARLLLDVAGSVTEQIRGKVDEQLTSQLDQALTQLRLAQVDAEKQLAQAQEAAEPAAPAADAGPAEQAPPSAQPGSPPTGKRLWTPGS